MRQLDRNYWRLGWVLVSNGAVALLLMTGPIRVHHDQELLYQSMRTTPPPFSYWGELFASPWLPAIIVLLLLGIVAEIRGNVLSPILNVGPYVVFLGMALWERARAGSEATVQELFLGKVLLIVPLAVVIVIGSIFYTTAFRRKAYLSGDED